MAKTNIVQQLAAQYGGTWEYDQGLKRWTDRQTGRSVHRNKGVLVWTASGKLVANIADPKAKAKKTPGPKAVKKSAVTAPKTTQPRLVNNVIFVLDESSSMSYHQHAVNKAFQDLLAGMRVSPDQDVRVSVYTFANDVRCAIFNAPVASVSHITLRPNGMTALIDASCKAIEDHVDLQRRTITSNEDHTYLMYVLTDGEENRSLRSANHLRALIQNLDDSWTVAALVPDITGAHRAKQWGFPAGNVEIWNTTSYQGLEEATRTMTSSFAAYSAARATGVRNTSALFKVNADRIDKKTVDKTLSEVGGTIFTVQQTGQIRDIVEAVTGRTYRAGDAFYELSKPETIQARKEIVIVDKKTGKKFGGANARHLLGIPSVEMRVAPGDFGDWRIFVQSTSVNRKITPGTALYIR